MIRLFIRISIAIMSVMFVTIVIDVVVLHRAMQREFRENPPAFVNAIGVAIEQQLGDVAVVNLAAEVERMRAQSGLPMELVSMGDARIGDDQRARLAKGRAVQKMTLRPGPIIYVPLRDENVVMIGPIIGMPSPHAADVALMVLAFLTVVGVVGAAVSYPQVRGLRELERATSRLARGDLDVRLRMKDGGPIGDLGRRFDDMAQTIQELLKRQRELVQAVAHEIRTPISRIRFGLEMATNAEDEHEREQLEAGVEEDLSELDSLVAELLIYCRYDHETATLPFEDADLAELVAAQVERQRAHFTLLDIETELPSSAHAVVDQTSFQRAVRNLLLNACRHADHKVIVRVVPHEASVIVEIHDDGPGVHASERQRIFEPFARVDVSRNRASGGVGLGLAIVRRILAAHGGRVEVGESPLGGALFTSSWPRSSDRTVSQRAGGDRT